MITATDTPQACLCFNLRKAARAVTQFYDAALEPAGLLLKTDAAIHAGISGGACVDARGRLVGIPTSSIADANAAGGLGLVTPLDLVPQEWRERFGWQ